MTLDELIFHYEGQVADHEAGTLMSMAEMVHGEYWCTKFLEELRGLKAIEDAKR